MNAQLKVGKQRLMISDENPEFEYKHGYNMTAAIIVDSVFEAKRIYEKLSEDTNKITMELLKKHFGVLRMQILRINMV